MIHVDVTQGKTDGVTDPEKFIVQTSTDGGGWKTQYVLHTQMDETPGRRTKAQQRAEDTARIFANGCRYAGQETRLTSMGYTLSSI